MSSTLHCARCGADVFPLIDRRLARAEALVEEIAAAAAKAGLEISEQRPMLRLIDGDDDA